MKNLLFIFTDEQRCDTLAAYGNNPVIMPHINALAGGFGDRQIFVGITIKHKTTKGVIR